MIPVHTSALVVIPPESIWQPIQEIRKEHDRNIRRWMPHITLFYPFVPHEDFSKIRYQLQQVCKNIQPFSLTLDEIGHFKQRRGNFILWAGCKEQQPLQDLHSALSLSIQKFMEVKKRPFHPHLTIGRLGSKESFDQVHPSIESDWEPLKWTVDKVSLIWRNDPPDDVFRIDSEILLGS